MNKMRTDDDTNHDRDCACLKCECLKASAAAFADAVNTGFYDNSYTTKQCPTMEGVLENLRQGLRRLEEQREREREILQSKRMSLEKRPRQSTQQGRTETLQRQICLLRNDADAQQTVVVISSLLLESGAEMIFPILYGHMTFASHRCWTVYVKKGVFKAAEAWRRLYGSSIRHAAIRAGGGEIIQHFRQGMDPYPL